MAYDGGASSEIDWSSNERVLSRQRLKCRSVVGFAIEHRPELPHIEREGAEFIVQRARNSASSALFKSNQTRAVASRGGGKLCGVHKTIRHLHSP